MRRHALSARIKLENYERLTVWANQRGLSLNAAINLILSQLPEPPQLPDAPCAPTALVTIIPKTEADSDLTMLGRVQ